MKTIRPDDDLKAALAAAQQSAHATDPQATVADGLKRWLKIHSIGNKPRSIDFNKELAAKVREHWPNLQTRIADVTQADCVAFAEAVGHFASSRYNGMVSIGV